MKVDQQFKERFFAQYYGQEVVNHRKINGRSIIKIDHKYFFLNKSIKNDFLELTPLSAITDEHAIEVAKLNRSINWNNGLTPHVWKNNFGATVVSNGTKHIQKYGQTLIGFEFLSSEQVDKCRELCYALPFGGKSVEELIEMGILKLREK